MCPDQHNQIAIMTSKTEAMTPAKATTQYSYKRIWHIAYPILISLLMEQLIGMTDTAFLGRVGEVELGASAIAGVYYLIIFMIGFGFSIGAQILIARRNGEGRQDEIGGIFYHSIGFLLVLATIACAFSLVFSPHILQGVVTSQAVCDKAVSYINWRVLGLFFAFTSAVFRAFYVGTTRTKTLTLNSILMVLSNVVFNYILVFGNFGCPALGIAGAAIGSTLAEAVSTTFFIIYTARRTDCKRYGLDKLTQFSRKTLTGILKISTWTMIQNFFSISIWFMFFIFIEHLGEHSLAITNIVRSISSIPYMIVAAFASTCSSIVSNLIGSGNIGQVWPTIRKHIVITYAVVIPVVAIISFFPIETASIYTNIDTIKTGAVHSLWVLCSSYMLTVPALVLFQSVSGTGNTRRAFMLEFTSTAVYTVFITIVIMHLKADVAYCWFAEHVYSGLLMTLCFLYLKRGNWSKTKI